MLLTGCEQSDMLSESEKTDTKGLMLSVTIPESLTIELMDNMKLLYYGVSTVNNITSYSYEGYYDLSDALYDSQRDSWIKKIPLEFSRTMGFMVVAQEDITSNSSYLLPAIGKGKEAILVNQTAESSSVITGTAYGDAPVVFVSAMTVVEWPLSDVGKNLNFNITRVVGKVVIKIKDHDNSMTKDMYFKISNTSIACTYGVQYSGSTTSTTPHIVKVDKTSKQGVVYLLPTWNATSFVIEPVDATLKLTATTPLIVQRNKITEVTIDYHGTLSMTAGGTVKEWTDILAGETECFDAADSENIGYQVINVNGILWLDRDLGARYAIPRKSTSVLPADLQSDDDWGYLFQFGRLRDLHQKRSVMALAGILTSVSDNTKPWFVYGFASWVEIPIPASKMAPLWVNPTQLNNQCPAGFRVPTIDELKTLYSQLSYDAILQGYYVNGTRRGKVVKMYLFGTTSRDSKNGTILPPSANRTLYYWTSTQRCDIGKLFYGTIPAIQVQNNVIVRGNDIEYPSTMGFNVRCIYNNSSEISH